MKSPFTGREAKLEKEVRAVEFRKDTLEVLFHFYTCIDTGEQFTTTEIDTLNINEIYNKSREKNGVPFSKKRR